LPQTSPGKPTGVLSWIISLDQKQVMHKDIYGLQYPAVQWVTKVGSTAANFRQKSE